MIAKTILVLPILLFGAILSSCGPSQAEVDAHATEVVAAIFATQTAEVPTNTPTLRATRTPTSTPTNTPTMTPTVTGTPTQTRTPWPSDLFQDPLSTPGECEPSIDPSQQDVDYILTYTGEIFDSDDWQRSYTVKELRTNVTWLNHQEGALAFLEYLIFSCGYTQDDFENFFSDQNLEAVIFVDYKNLKRLATCTSNEEDLMLHEFSAEVQDRQYLVYYWIKLDRETRILTMLLTFPRESEAKLVSYASAIFPELSSCHE
ncbi:MAG: hypothetical protein GTO14_10335 [Anaerolineales bacterium]|nr:hypothetical protein [Anaerolineales bacterium]